MKLFHRHLYLFENYSQITRYNVIDFSQSKEMSEKDIVMFVMKNKHDKDDKVIYRFVIADTDINALFSFFNESKYEEYELKYILRENQIKDIINGKENYAIPEEGKDDIKETYEMLLKKDISKVDDFFINRRLLTAEYELDESKRNLHIFEYDLYIKTIKDLIKFYKDFNYTKKRAIVFCEAYLKQIADSYFFYLQNPIGNFNIEKSYDYINDVTFNRLDEKQKKLIKKYYEDVDKIYEYHLTTVRDKIDEAGNLLNDFRKINEI